jgi:sortase A
MLELAAVSLLLAVAAGVVATFRRNRPSRAAAALATPSAAARPEPGDVRPRGVEARIVGFLRRRPWARRSLSLASVALLLGAAGMLGYPFYTNLYQSRIQSQLDRQLVSPELQQAYLDRRVGTGDALTRIKIPAIDVDVVVVEGTTASALRAGAGHYPTTPLPCEPGNVAIAGHRTTYGKPFHHLDRLAPGDQIVLETPVGSCTYEIREVPFIVAPTNLDVVAPTAEPTLTLTTCHPKGSAKQRLIVQAVLVGPAAPA